MLLPTAAVPWRKSPQAHTHTNYCKTIHTHKHTNGGDVVDAGGAFQEILLPVFHRGNFLTIQPKLGESRARGLEKLGDIV